MGAESMIIRHHLRSEVTATSVWLDLLLDVWGIRLDDFRARVNGR